MTEYIFHFINMVLLSDLHANSKFKGKFLEVSLRLPRLNEYIKTSTAS